MHNAAQADLNKLETCFFECDEDLASCSRISCERRESRAAARRRREQRRSFLCERRRRRRIQSTMREQLYIEGLRASGIARRRTETNCASEVSTSPSGELCGGEESRGVLSSASDDDGGGSKARGA